MVSISQFVILWHNTIISSHDIIVLRGVSFASIGRKRYRINEYGFKTISNEPTLLRQ